MFAQRVREAAAKCTSSALVHHQSMLLQAAAKVQQMFQSNATRTYVHTT